ncbi:hypothetical protein PHLCEN_2v2001 [Hermanssonia centrifuga]|uniref:DUF6589 domain-containing protein n=1 Tax=Hermanssonia centrifuga TaxID=98765 RepID=A0A2R6RQD6_9APHY|nr:hypothetical protein PHLCEN_2v2001 [Hermanssonia centrifuga]
MSVEEFQSASRGVGTLRRSSSGDRARGLWRVTGESLTEGVSAGVDAVAIWCNMFIAPCVWTARRIAERAEAAKTKGKHGRKVGTVKMDGANHFSTQGRLAENVVGILGQQCVPTLNSPETVRMPKLDKQRPLLTLICMMDKHIVNSVLVALQGHSIGEFLITLLSDPSYSHCPVTVIFLNDWAELLGILATLPPTKIATEDFASQLHTRILSSEVSRLATKQSGWHFSAVQAKAEQVEAFSIDDMASKFPSHAPRLWELVSCLLESDPSRAHRRKQYLNRGKAADGAEGVEWDDEDEFWWQSEEGICQDGLNGMKSGEERPTKRKRTASKRRHALHQIKCNPLASIMGLFLHSTSAPELVIEVLSHAGLSISVSAIHDMVDSLSRTSHSKLRDMAKSLLTALAYDNFDMDFKSWVSTVEKPGGTLQHATSALVLPLRHGVTADDLKCSAELWASDPLNPHIPASQKRPSRTWKDCLPPVDPTQTGPPRQIQNFSWHFRHALVKYCKEFDSYRTDLKYPEAVLEIPVVQTPHLPCRAMDINQSTNDGQSEILESLLAQTNLGDPSDHPGVEDITEHVVIIHGDLGTGERLDGAKQSRCIERKPVRRLQYAIFVPGLFHVQMACADAIHRMFIDPKHLRMDPNGLYQQACKVRPYDSGRIASKPGFGLMHDLLLQCADARMLDAWRVEIKKTHNKTLQEYAATKPDWSNIIDISIRLASSYLDKPSSKDKIFRNNSLVLARLLPYVELSHAMKHGDIGRVEDTFLHWVFVFKSVGKHKYATALVKIMTDLKYVYSKRLAKAIRLNWLCNPTGKQDGFRAVDWVVELMNLYTKVVYSGSGSSRTFQLVLKQSPLIQVFRQVHTLMQDNFFLLHRTVRHAPSDLRNTIKALCDELERNKAHEYNENRQTAPDLIDHFREGMRILQTTKTTPSTDDSANDFAGELELDDLEVI